MRYSRHISISIVVLLAIAASAQTDPRSPIIEPAGVLMTLGQSQTFELFDNAGQRIQLSDWSLDNTEVAELMITNGRATVTAKGEGQIVLKAGSSTAEISVTKDALSIGLTEPRWIWHPIDGHFVNGLQAWQTWAGWAEDVDGEVNLHFPAYFYEDRGVDGSHIRAIRKDGVQAWQWPHYPSDDKPRMICGDIYGGVLIAIGEEKSPTLINLDARGKERWRTSAPGFGTARAYDVSGIYYYIQDDSNKKSARLVALDARTGRESFSSPLPESRELFRNLSMQNGKPTCSPGSETVISTPVYHSSIMTGPGDFASFSYTESSIVVDGGECVANAPLTLREIRIKAKQRLIAVDHKRDGSFTTYIVEENTSEGPADSTSIVSTIPTGEIVPGDGDTGQGNFLAVRKLVSYWGSKSQAKTAEYHYRISSNREILYRMPITNVSAGGRGTTVLGEERFGFTSRGDTVVAFDQDTGKERWRWKGHSRVCLIAALKEGAVMVRDGSRYFIVKNGKVESERAEEFMLFVMKFLPADDDE